MDNDNKDLITSRLRVCLILALILLVVTLLPANANAANLVTRAKSRTTPAGKVVETRAGWRYKLKSGSYIKSKWLYINGKVMAFDSKGYARTGWFSYGSNKYYASSKGYIYYSKWHTENGKRYFLRGSGIMAKSCWLKINGKYYRFASDGSLITRRIYKVSGKYYYSDKNGVRRSNLWVKSGSKRYYFGKDAVRVHDTWVFYKENFYYLLSDGSMARNTEIDGWIIGDDGIRQTKKKAPNIYVGDSRTCGIQSSVTAENTSFICKVGEGYNWLVGSAQYELAGKLQASPQASVIFGFGINDIANVDKYIAFYKTLIRKYPKAHFFFLSVNPIDNAMMARYGYASASYLTEPVLQNFNTKLKAAFGTSYIDTYTWMKNLPFSTFDGLHYNTDTNQKLFRYVNAIVNKAASK